MVRKILCCIVVLALISFSVVPAFATSSSGGSTVVSPDLSIDYIKLANGPNAGAIVDWPNNWSASSPSHNYISGSNDFFGYSILNHPGSQSSSSGFSFETTLYVGQASSIQLFCSDVFFYQSPSSVDLDFRLDDDGYDSFRISTVSIKGDFCYVNNSSSGVYLISSTPFTLTTSVNSSFVQFGSIFRDAIRDLSDGGNVWLKDVTISISYYSTDPNTALGLHFTCAGNSRTVSYNPFSAWFHSRSLSFERVEFSEVGLFDWLVNSVNALFNIEIAPNLTLNALFYVVLVALIFIAVIKLIS